MTANLSESDTDTAHLNFQTLDLDRSEEGAGGFSEKANQVFGNSLIVERICSFIKTPADLLNLRLVNHHFQQKASKRLRSVHKHIPLGSSDVNFLIAWTKRRESLNLTPFPFTAFEVDLELENLKTFGSTVGQYIQRLKIRHQSSHETSKRLAMLLSSSPNLTELLLKSNWNIYVPEDDISLFPASFPHLRVLGLTNGGFIDPEFENGYTLCDLLISRATQLKIFKVPVKNGTPSMSMLNLFVQKRPNNLPCFSLEDCITIWPSTTSIIQEIIGLNLKFTEISISVNSREPNETQSMVRAVGTWLETQRRCLTVLCIKVCLHPDSTPFQFPVLLALKNLTIKYPIKVLPYDYRPILPFIGNPFPSLQNLCLERYREDFGLFGACSMSSVEELHLRFLGNPLADPSWPLTFPNLTNLHIEFDPDSSMADLFRSTLSYILTHLTQLVHLDLELSRDWSKVLPAMCPLSNWGCWDLLTGGTPRSTQEFTLNQSHWSFGEPETLEEPVNGVYRVPSLQNMTALKTLRFFPRLRLNLAAILYMTRVGKLVPLQKLVLSSLLPHENALLFTSQGIAEYRRVLCVHQEVEFVTMEPRRNCKKWVVVSTDR